MTHCTMYSILSFVSAIVLGVIYFRARRSAEDRRRNRARSVTH